MPVKRRFGPIMARVLVIGSGGREHAMAWALSRSDRVQRVYVAPGNGGCVGSKITRLARARDADAWLSHIRSLGIDLVVIGSEGPLVAGFADRVVNEAEGAVCLGPMRAAAQLEGSKRWMKQFCDRQGIPTAAWRSFDDAADACAYVRSRPAARVIKTDGLAAGKGVVVADSLDDAIQTIHAFMRDGRHGDAGRHIVIEDRLQGREVSVFALLDGETAQYLGEAQDYKRALDGDQGPNTGGMGAVVDDTLLTPEERRFIEDRMIAPVLRGMRAEGHPYRGILFAGVMLTDAGPFLLEYNVRWGDPECQAMLMRLGVDLFPLLCDAARGTLAPVDPSRLWQGGAALALVLAAQGYPLNPRTGGRVTGIDAAVALAKQAMPHRAQTTADALQVFHAGTEQRGGELIARGGRVLTLCACAATMEDARRLAYACADAIEWNDAVMRRDIGTPRPPRFTQPTAHP